MKKIILSTALMSTVLLGGVQIASAAEVKTADTPVGIEFEKETDVVPGPYKGVLTLVYKPSALDFGKYKATGAQITAPAINLGDGKAKQYLVVNDDRGYAEKPGNSDDENNKKGGIWNLTAKMSELTDGKATGATVLPATLKLNFKDAQQYTMGTTPSDDGQDYKPNHPTDTDALSVLPENQNINLTKSVSLTSGGAAVKVMTKSPETTEKIGVATQLESSELVVQPQDNFGGKMSSKITWTLSTGI